MQKNPRRLILLCFSLLGTVSVSLLASQIWVKLQRYQRSVRILAERFGKETTKTYSLEERNLPEPLKLQNFDWYLMNADDVALPLQLSQTEGGRIWHRTVPTVVHYEQDFLSWNNRHKLRWKLPKQPLILSLIFNGL